TALQAQERSLFALLHIDLEAAVRTCPKSPFFSLIACAFHSDAPSHGFEGKVALRPAPPPAESVSSRLFAPIDCAHVDVTPKAEVAASTTTVSQHRMRWYAPRSHHSPSTPVLLLPTC